MDDFEMVTQKSIHAIVAPLVEGTLAPLGFESVGTLKWVRSADTPIKQIFCFFQWKGGAAAPSWGISLDFVPNISGGKVKWHRTTKAAVLDLRVDARERELDIPYHRGLAPIRSTAPRVIREALGQARDFWDRSRRVSDLLAACEWVRHYYESQGPVGFYGFTQHPLTLAFALAINGRRQEALVALNRFLEWPPLPDEVAERLRHLVASAGTA